MTLRRSHPTSFWVKTVTPDEWSCIERAGRITICQEERNKLQSAYERYQTCAALDAASPPIRNVRNILKKLAGNLDDCRFSLAQLLEDGSANKSALHQLREAFALGGAPSPERLEIDGLSSLLETYSGAAKRAIARQPSGGRGQISRQWQDEFFECAQSVFEDAEGPKKLRHSYMDAVRAVVGYRAKADSKSERRKVDKLRRRKRMR